MCLTQTAKIAMDLYFIVPVTSAKLVLLQVVGQNVVKYKVHLSKLNIPLYILESKPEEKNLTNEMRLYYH